MTRRKKPVSPVKRAARFITAPFYLRHCNIARMLPPQPRVDTFEKADTAKNVIAESRIKAGSASFLCKSVDGAVSTHLPDFLSLHRQCDDSWEE